MKDLITEVVRAANKIDRPVRIMEVCGGHTNTVMRYGIRDILPKHIKLISGPGCPVCVTTQHEIDCMIELALEGHRIATYGDMLRVPGTRGTLEEAREQGADVHMVYSAAEVLKLHAPIFFGIGFETTAPMTAFLLKNKVKVYSAHKLIPPAMEALQDDVDGFINPGHVSTIIGMDAYKAKVAQVIAGFEAEQFLKALYMLLVTIRQGKNKVLNAYPEAVRRKGNAFARELIQEHFRIVDAEWRGLGIVKKSGLAVKDKSLDAKELYKDTLAKVKTQENACRCGDVLKGMDPKGCPLFGRCNPENPMGACMVSSEGSCQIAYKYDAE